jgi:hypothetical protein
LVQATAQRHSPYFRISCRRAKQYSRYRSSMNAHMNPPVVEEFYRARMTLLLMYDEKAMCSIEHGRALERDGFLRRQLQ